MPMLTPVSMAGILGLCTTHPWKTIGGVGRGHGDRGAPHRHPTQNRH
jgi:hypothetical protein